MTITQVDILDGVHILEGKTKVLEAGFSSNTQARQLKKFEKHIKFLFLDEKIKKLRQEYSIDQPKDFQSAPKQVKRKMCAVLSNIFEKSRISERWKQIFIQYFLTASFEKILVATLPQPFDVRVTKDSGSYEVALVLYADTLKKDVSENWELISKHLHLVSQTPTRKGKSKNEIVYELGSDGQLNKRHYPQKIEHKRSARAVKIEAEALELYLEGKSYSEIITELNIGTGYTPSELAKALQAYRSDVDSRFLY